MLFWHVPAPNEALLISGSRRKAQDTQFRIVTGHGCFVLPIKQKARFLSLSLQEAEIAEDCITTQGIRLHIRAIAAFKVGDDPASIANAARRFLAEQNNMEELVGRIFAGHLRSIIGSLTVEEIIRERDRLAQEVKDGSHGEMEKLGIVVDSLQIQEIEDCDRIHQQHRRTVRRRGGQPGPDRQRQGRPGGHPAGAGGAALKAEYERDTAIKKAGFSAETEQAKAAAAQAGPLAASQGDSGCHRAADHSGRDGQPSSPRSNSSPRCAGRPTPRPTRRGPWPTPTGTGSRPRPKPRRSGSGPSPRPVRDTVNFQTEAEANRQRRMAEAEADAEKVKAEADADGQEARSRRRRLRRSGRWPKPRRRPSTCGPTRCPREIRP